MRVVVEKLYDCKRIFDVVDKTEEEILTFLKEKGYDPASGVGLRDNKDVPIRVQIESSKECPMWAEKVLLKNLLQTVTLSPKENDLQRETREQRDEFTGLLNQTGRTIRDRHIEIMKFVLRSGAYENHISDTGRSIRRDYIGIPEVFDKSILKTKAGRAMAFKECPPTIGLPEAGHPTREECLIALEGLERQYKGRNVVLSTPNPVLSMVNPTPECVGAALLLGYPAEDMMGIIDSFHLSEQQKAELLALVALENKNGFYPFSLNRVVDADEHVRIYGSEVDMDAIKDIIGLWQYKIIQHSMVCDAWGNPQEPVEYTKSVFLSADDPSKMLKPLKDFGLEETENGSLSASTGSGMGWDFLYIVATPVYVHPMDISDNLVVSADIMREAFPSPWMPSDIGEERQRDTKIFLEAYKKFQDDLIGKKLPAGELNIPCIPMTEKQEQAFRAKSSPQVQPSHEAKQSSHDFDI